VHSNRISAAKTQITPYRDRTGWLGRLDSGTPDQVLTQFKEHCDHVGGYGHLLIMGQAGFLEHDDTVHGIKMFVREVYPRLKELYPDTKISSLEHTVKAAVG
jgi:hypothetical protein